VISAFNGKAGIEIVREENPDIVLLDINLPRSSLIDIVTLRTILLCDSKLL